MTGPIFILDIFHFMNQFEPIRALAVDRDAQ